MTTNINENKLMDVASVKELILQGRKLVLAADEIVLEQLPKGNWIGGTMPYFYLKGEKGRMDKENIMVADFTDYVRSFKIKTVHQNNLAEVCANGFENGFHFLILPALRDIHFSFALNSSNYKDLYKNPLLGFVAGADLEEFIAQGKLSKTYNGFTSESYTEEGVVMYAELNENKVARIEVVNDFVPNQAHQIEVFDDSFKVKNCLINGKEENLYDYIIEHKLNTQNPLMSDYAGAKINISFLSLDEQEREVVFYAPLFKGKKYTYSERIGSYKESFKEAITPILERENNILYSNNCILNYVYGKLDQTSIDFTGASVFGGIAYILLNQTFAYLTIDEN